MKISLFIYFLLISFLSFAQDESNVDSVLRTLRDVPHMCLYPTYDENAKPVKGIKVVYEKFREIKKSECFQSIPDLERFKVMVLS
ncbi:MAG: hypothetical protein ACJAWV_003041 [Flammeovirgaceae bacterium]|jgi:hypothetical protein